MTDSEKLKIAIEALEKVRTSKPAAVHWIVTTALGKIREPESER
jgi:hypothetical protein